MPIFSPKLGSRVAVDDHQQIALFILCTVYFETEYTQPESTDAREEASSEAKKQRHEPNSKMTSLEKRLTAMFPTKVMSVARAEFQLKLV